MDVTEPASSDRPPAAGAARTGSTALFPRFPQTCPRIFLRWASKTESNGFRYSTRTGVFSLLAASLTLFMIVVMVSCSILRSCGVGAGLLAALAVITATLDGAAGASLVDDVYSEERLPGMAKAFPFLLTMFSVMVAVVVLILSSLSIVAPLEGPSTLAAVFCGLVPFLGALLESDTKRGTDLETSQEREEREVR